MKAQKYKFLSFDNFTGRWQKKRPDDSGLYVIIRLLSVPFAQETKEKKEKIDKVEIEG